MRLVFACAQKSLVAFAQQYDANGNRNSVDWTTGAANRLLTSPLLSVVYAYTYDKEGNRTARFRDNNGNGVYDSGDTDATLYVYDYRNRLSGVAFATGYGGAYTEIIAYSHDYAEA